MESRRVLWASALLLLACKGPKTEIVPEQVTVKYCEGGVQVRDVEQCVFELTPEQQRKRSRTRRLTYRGKQVVRREFVSGSGALTNDDVEDYQYANGRVSVVLHTSRNGVALGREVFSADGATVQFVDEQGRPKLYHPERVPGIRREFDAAGLVQSTRYVDIAGNPLGNGDVYEKREKHGPGGLMTEYSYFGRDGEPVKVRCAHRTVYETNDRGKLLSETIFDDEGKPAHCNGVHITRYKYDEVGNASEFSFFDVEGHPKLSYAWGAAILRMQRDARGNETSHQLFGVDGRPTLGKRGYASASTRYDAQDRAIEHAYFGIDGSPVNLGDEGYSISRHTYDARGNTATIRYLDRDGARVLTSDGYFQVGYEYDARDQCVTERYRDLAEQPVKSHEGCAVKKRLFDGHRVVGYSLFDAAEQPTAGVDKWARAELAYDVNGRDGKWTLFDLQGKQVQQEEKEEEDCHGTAGPALRAEVEATRTGARACYQALLGRDSAAQGKVVVDVRISATGEVTKATIASSQLGDGVFAQCILSNLRRPFRHRPDKGCVIIRLPLSFIKQ